MSDVNHVPDDRSLGRMYGRHAAQAVAALVAKRWPDVNARAQILSHEGGKQLVMIVVDARKLRSHQLLSELVHYVEGCIDMVVEHGDPVSMCDAEAAPEIPF